MLVVIIVSFGWRGNSNSPPLPLFLLPSPLNQPYISSQKKKKKVIAMEQKNEEIKKKGNGRE